MTLLTNLSTLCQLIPDHQEPPCFFTAIPRTAFSGFLISHKLYLANVFSENLAVFVGPRNFYLMALGNLATKLFEIDETEHTEDLPSTVAFLFAPVDDQKNIEHAPIALIAKPAETLWLAQKPWKPMILEIPQATSHAILANLVVLRTTLRKIVDTI